MVENKALTHPLYYYTDILQMNNIHRNANAFFNILRVKSFLRNNSADFKCFAQLYANKASKHLLRYYVDLLRGRDAEHIRSALSNNLRVMSLSRNNAIDAENFTELDFKGITLHTYDFAGDRNTPSNFSGSKLYVENFYSIIAPFITKIEVSEKNDLLLVSNKNHKIQVWKLHNKILRFETTLPELLTWCYIESENKILCVCKNGIVSEYDIDGHFERSYKLINGATSCSCAVFMERTLYIALARRVYLIQVYNEPNSPNYFELPQSDNSPIEQLLIKDKNIIVSTKRKLYRFSHFGEIEQETDLKVKPSFWVYFQGGYAVASEKEVYFFDFDLKPILYFTDFPHEIEALNQINGELAVCLANGSVHIYKKELKQFYVWRPHLLGVLCIQAYGKYIVTSSIDNCLYFWRPQNDGDFVKVDAMKAYAASFIQTDSTDTHLVVASQFHPIVEMWDINEEKKVSYINTHSDGASSVKLFSNIALISTFSGCLYRWDWRKKSLSKREFRKPILKMDAIDNGRFICMLLWNNGQAQLTIINESTDYQLEIHINSIRPTTVKFLDNNYIAVSSLEGLLEIYDLKGNQVYCDYPLGGASEIYDLFPSYNGSMLGIQSPRRISFFSMLYIESPVFCTDYMASEEFVSAAAPYKKNNLIAVYDDGKINILTIHGAIVRKTIPCENTVLSLAPSYNKTKIISGTSNSSIVKYDTNAIEPIVLHYRPEMHFINCPFGRIVCTDDVKKLLLQQGAII